MTVPGRKSALFSLAALCALAAVPGGVALSAVGSPAKPSLRHARTAAGSFAAVVHATRLASVSKLVLGANMGLWYDVTQSGLAPSFGAAGIVATRWPGGSAADQYHWQAHALCAGGYANPNSTFDNFETSLAEAAKLDVAVTLDYGSNAACNAGGDPNEAAAWVDYANNQKHYGVTYWTVGNEVYGDWEYDLHAPAHDSATYANAVATGFYPAIKAKDPKALVGVVVQPGWNPDWDTNVLTKAPYDFVEYHYYAQAPGQESDAYLLQQAPAAFGSALDAVRADLVAAGRPKTPIYVGELGSVYSNPGKQTTSITQSLYAGMSLGEMLNRGIFRSTWWIGYGGCSDDSSGNFSPSLYGWQNFGGYMIFSDGTPEYGCPNATPVARGTLLPTTRAYQLFSTVVRDGEHALAISVTGATIRGYALTHAGGHAVVLFNLDRNDAAAVPLTIDGVGSGKGYSIATYGRAQYDRSQNNVWAGPVSMKHGAWHGAITVTLPPWSMNVVDVRG